jgi:hypothetical protein
VQVPDEIVAHLPRHRWLARVALDWATESTTSGHDAPLPMLDVNDRDAVGSNFSQPEGTRLPVSPIQSSDAHVRLAVEM